MKKKIKSKRGFKICESCYSSNGVRTKVCKHCQCKFPPPQQKVNFKKRKIKVEPIDWKTLQKGDRIRVYSGGTIFNGVDSTYNIERNGVYIVRRVIEDGILANDKKYGGNSFIYMGAATVKENKLGFINTPHIIKKIVD